MREIRRKKRIKEKNWPKPGCGVCGFSRQLPDFSRLTSSLVYYLHPPGGAPVPGAAPAELRALAASSRPPPASVSQSSGRGLSLLPALPCVVPGCAPRSGDSCCRRARARCPGGNQRGNKETNLGRPRSRRPNRPNAEWARGGGVTRGGLVGLSLRVDPVPLLRVGPSEVGKALRASLRKCIKNLWRRRV